MHTSNFNLRVIVGTLVNFVLAISYYSGDPNTVHWVNGTIWLTNFIIGRSCLVDSPLTKWWSKLHSDCHSVNGLNLVQYSDAIGLTYRSVNVTKMPDIQEKTCPVILLIKGQQSNPYGGINSIAGVFLIIYIMCEYERTK